MDNLSCPTDVQVADLRDEGMPQIYLLSGSGARSSLRIIKQGLEVKELATKKLMKPQAVWTLKAQFTDHSQAKPLCLCLSRMAVSTRLKILVLKIRRIHYM
jgi:hypothetical protein